MVKEERAKRKGDAEGSNGQSREGKERGQSGTFPGAPTQPAFPAAQRSSQQWVRVVCHLAEAPVESWDTQPHRFVEFGVRSCV